MSTGGAVRATISVIRSSGGGSWGGDPGEIDIPTEVAVEGRATSTDLLYSRGGCDAWNVGGCGTDGSGRHLYTPGPTPAPITNSQISRGRDSRGFQRSSSRLGSGREALVARLRRDVERLRAVPPLSRATLIGSWATGRQTAASDVDLLVIYADPARADAYQIVRRVIRIRGLEPHVYADEEAAALAETLGRMTRAGIELLSEA